MSQEINQDRRLFLGTVARTIADVHFDTIGSMGQGSNNQRR